MYFQEVKLHFLFLDLVGSFVAYNRFLLVLDKHVNIAFDITP